MELASLLEFFKHLIVTLASGVLVDWMLRRKRVALANEEVLQSVQKVVAAKDAENAKRIDSIISSAARKHHLSEEKLFDVKALMDEIINKVWADPFISPHQRQDYSAFADRIKKAHVTAPPKLTKVNLAPGRRKDLVFILGFAVLAAMLLNFLGANVETGPITLNNDAIKKIVGLVGVAITASAIILLLVDRAIIPGQRVLNKMLGNKRKKSR